MKVPRKSCKRKRSCEKNITECMQLVLNEMDVESEGKLISTIGIVKNKLTVDITSDDY